MKNRLIRILVIALLIIAVIVLTLFLLPGKKLKPVTVKIGIAKNQYIQDINTNYYKHWLEEKTGLNIEFVIFPETYTSEYLDIMFQSDSNMIDGFFSFPCEKASYLTNSIMEEYGKKGYILPLNNYIKNSKIMQELFTSFEAYNLKKVMTSSDGNIYYMPGLDNSFSQEYSQILWMNQSWLKKLGLTIPETTQELKAVLTAFLQEDPNDNGKQDEIPLVGCCDNYSEQSFQFLINAFTYSDPYNSYMKVDDGKVVFAPITSEWRNAMQYLQDIYTEGLLSPMQFTLNKTQLIQLVNDKRNLVGAFTSSSISDVVLQSSPEIISNYVCVKPISGYQNARYATVNTALPSANGIIIAGSKHKDEVFRLYEAMMSEEAFLIGRYGEEGVDWEYAKTGDIDIIGNSATINIINYLENKPQNKTLLETGPFITYTTYSNGVTWNGFEADQEYMNARAYSSYSKYKPKDYVETILFDNENQVKMTDLRRTIDDDTNEMLIGFIQGKYDPYDDEEWEDYIDYYYDHDIDKYIEAVQNSYDELKK